MCDKLEEPFSDAALLAIFASFDLITRSILAHKSSELRPFYFKTGPVIQKVTLEKNDGCPGEAEGLLTCKVDSLELNQSPDQSDKEFFEMIQNDFFRKYVILELEVFQLVAHWLQRIPWSFSFPLVQKLRLEGGFAAELKDLINFPVDEASSLNGNTYFFNLGSFRNARVLKVDQMMAHCPNIDALKECKATRWDLNTFVSNDIEDDFVFERLASGVMEPGTIYQQRCYFPCEPFVTRILEKYPEVVQETEGEKFTLDLKNGTQLVMGLVQKEECTVMKLKIVGQKVDPVKVREKYVMPKLVSRWNRRPLENKKKVHKRSASKMANPVMITRKSEPKPTKTGPNNRPREGRPFTEEALPQILRFVELNKRRNWAKRIPGIRYGFERTRPAPIKKVMMGCTKDGFRPIFIWEGYLFVNIDGEDIKQAVGQTDEDFFNMIEPRIFRKEQRIVEFHVESTLRWLDRRLSHHYFKEMPIVKKFVLEGGCERNSNIFYGMRPFEAKCDIGTNVDLYPMQTARVLSFVMMIGSSKCMEILRNVEATRWDTNVIIHSEEDKDDWVFERFASGTMKIGSIYRGSRSWSCEPLFERMLKKFPGMKRIGEEKEKYVLELDDGKRLMSWVNRTERDENDANPNFDGSVRKNNDFFEKSEPSSLQEVDDSLSSEQGPESFAGCKHVIGN